jgi:tetratricopeptide (TPR) repeat protein
MNCENCNAEIPEDIKFCPECGFNLQILIKDKSNFDVKVLKKIFSEKEKHLSIETPAEDRTELIKSKKRGWGWYALAGIVFISIGKQYSSALSIQKDILILFGTFISVPLYFYFRNKVFDEMSAIKTRSFISGLISYFITAVLVTVLAVIIIPSNHDTAEEYFKKGTTKYDAKDFLGAIQDYTKAVEINPNLSEVYSARAAAKIKNKDYNGAIQDCNKILELDDKNSTAYTTRGFIKNYISDYRGAILDFTKALDINTNDAKSYLGRSVAEYNISEYIKSVQDNSKALEINPNYAEAYFNRGVDKFKKGDKKGACSDWTKAGELGLSEAYEYIKENCK